MVGQRFPSLIIERARRVLNSANGIPDLAVKFDSAAVAAILKTSNAVVTVTGLIANDCFSTTNLVRVNNK
jgi:hypothetical protein